MTNISTGNGSRLTMVLSSARPYYDERYRERERPVPEREREPRSSRTEQERSREREPEREREREVVSHRTARH